MTFRRSAILLLVVLLVLPLSAPGAGLAAPHLAAGAYVVDAKLDQADANPGDGVCQTTGGVCTLRAAIEEANLDGVASTITFAAQFQETDYISACNLPAITDPGTTIDGSSQWDAGYGWPGVELRGSGCTLLTIAADNTTIYGLRFGGTSSTGIHITGGGYSVIGGSGAGQRNVFGALKYGVYVPMSAGILNRIEYNYIGTGRGEYVIPGGETGIQVGAVGTMIENNLIVGQSVVGIGVVYGQYTFISDNIIGLNASKTAALPNAVGVMLSGDYNVVGSGNVIAGNSSHGVQIYKGDGNLIIDNDIGYALNGPKGNGGNGIHVTHALTNTITANIIRHNAGSGIHVDLAGWGGLVEVGGNTITDNAADGIYLYASTAGSRIGGTTSGDANAIGDNGDDGIHLDTCQHITVTGNLIGFDGVAGAFDYGNDGHGIHISGGSTDNLIGGTGAGEGNHIGFNGKDGVLITGSGATRNRVLGNVVGAASGYAWEAPNVLHGIAVYDGAHDNDIGEPGAGNTIVENGWSGVAVVDSDDNTVAGNRIGIDPTGADWGNAYHGVSLVNAAGNVVYDNEIAHNGDGVATDRYGIQVKGATATANAITENRIHDHYGAGIALEEGAADNIQAPTITQASCNGPVVGTACVNCYIEVFSDDGNEGRIYQGHFTTDSSGNFSWAGKPTGPNVTATARDHATRNTSGFSERFAVTGCNTPPSPGFTVTPAVGDTNTAFQFDASGSSDNEDAPSALEVRWDWEFDGNYDTPWSTTKTATHTYATAGAKAVALEVRDTLGATGVMTQALTVEAPPPPANQPPVAAFAFTPVSGDTTTVFAFDASFCTDNEDPTSALEVRWDWEDDGIWDTSWSPNKIADHRFEAWGVHHVRLEVLDTGLDSDTLVRPVEVLAPHRLMVPMLRR